MAIDEQFWAEEREKMFDVVFPIIEGSTTTAAINAAEALSRGGIEVSFNLINEAAVNYARGHTLSLVKDINARTQNVINKKLSDWIETGEPLDKLISQFVDAEDIGGMVGKVRAENIAITETTMAFQEGNIITWSASGEVDGFKFNTANDGTVCEICEPLNQKEYPLSEVVNSPPVHPRCRCWSQPTLKEPL